MELCLSGNSHVYRSMCVRTPVWVSDGSLTQRSSILATIPSLSRSFSSVLRSLVFMSPFTSRSTFSSLSHPSFTATRSASITADTSVWDTQNVGGPGGPAGRPANCDDTIILLRY